MANKIMFFSIRIKFKKIVFQTIITKMILLKCAVIVCGDETSQKTELSCGDGKNLKTSFSQTTNEVGGFSKNVLMHKLNKSYQQF